MPDNETTPIEEVTSEPEVKVEKPKKARKDYVNNDVVEAAKKLVALYEKTHLIKSDADYRLPGLKDLVLALRN